MLQAAGGLGLAMKTRQQIGALGGSGSNGFHRDVAPNERVAALEDHAHCSAADLLEDFVSANLLFFGLRHRHRPKTRP